MPFLKDISLQIQMEELLKAQERGRGQAIGSRSFAVEEAAREAVSRLHALVAPALLYEVFPTEGVKGEELYLAGGHVVTVGPHADLLAPAREVVVAVYTIGSCLEEAVEELFEEGESLLAFMLDSAGVMALGKIGEVVFHLAEERAASLGWGVSPSLAPGSLEGWPVSGQKELCALLPLGRIGVRLNEYCVLIPHKSSSVLIGLGPGYKEHAVGSICRFCCLADVCWRRR